MEENVDREIEEKTLEEELAIEWEKLIKLHQYTKKLHLLAEEVSFEHKTFLPPLQEKRHILEHIMRFMYVLIGNTGDMGPDDVKKYVLGNMKKAIGHAYRCFFDTADWYSIVIREQITCELNGYSDDSIDNALPRYFTEIKPNIVKTIAKIANLRGSKDITDRNVVLKEVDDYRLLLESLFSYYEYIVQNKKALIDCKKEINK